MASLEPSPAQATARDAVLGLLASECPTTRVRAAEPLGFDAPLWDALRATGALAPDTLADLVTVSLVAEALGAHLAPVPYAEHAAAVRTLAAADRAAPPGILTLDLGPRPGRLVPAGAVADHVVARRGAELVLVSGAPPGAGPRNLPALPLADRDLTGRRAAVASGPGAADAWDAGVVTWLVATAAALVGLADRALALTVDYAKARVQFGVSIGSFQAVQHTLADRVTAVEGARLLTWYAASRGSRADAIAAFVFATETARDATAAAMQFHGGRGFRLDEDPQLFHRRSRGWPSVVGDLAGWWRALGGCWYDPDAQGDGPVPTATREGIDFRIPAHAEEFRSEVREFLARECTPEIRERVHTTGTVHDWGFHRALAARGWIGLAWPRQEGGQGRDPWETRVFAEECALADAPTDALSIVTMIGNTIRVVGTAEQKARILPGLLRGEDLLCMGYTEPEAGSDVAAARTTAVRDGDDWIVDGEKVYTSMAHEAAYVFLLTRTDPAAPKHKGLTMFLVPMDTPGITVEPIWTLGAPGRTNRTTYRDVRVPDACRIGEVNGGWAVMNVALTFERGGNFAPVRALRAAEEWAAGTGRLVEPEVRARLARVRVRNEVSALLSLKSTWKHASGALPGVEGSMAKLFAASAFQASTADLLELTGAEGLLHELEPDAPAQGVLEEQWRKSPVVTVYGGTNEVLRTIIAERHLGLPRTR